MDSLELLVESKSAENQHLFIVPTAPLKKVQYQHCSTGREESITCKYIYIKLF